MRVSGFRINLMDLVRTSILLGEFIKVDSLPVCPMAMEGSSIRMGTTTRGM